MGSLLLLLALALARARGDFEVVLKGGAPPAGAGAAGPAGSSRVDIQDHVCFLPGPRAPPEPPQALEARAAAAEQLRGQCLEAEDAFWSFDVCLGGRVRQFRRADDGKRTQVVLVGRFASAALPPAAGGGASDWLVQQYRGGHEGRSADVVWQCGRELALAAVHEGPALHTEFWLRAPMACPADADAEAAPAADLAPALREAVDALPPSARCATRKEGWWTFELCLRAGGGAELRQVHGSDAGNVLGRAAVDEPLRAAPGPPPAVELALGGGDHCADAGRARRATARFLCGPASRALTLSAVEEPEPCVYVVTAFVKKLCEAAVAPPRTQAIECYARESVAL